MENANVDIDKYLEELKTYLQKHKDIGGAMFKAYGGAYYPIDLFATATLHRSINLLSGFCVLVQNRNIICAAPLLRLQIDNCARFFAAFIVDNPHDFAMSVLEGKQINKQKDQSGKLMTDAYLIGKLSKENPWVGRVYKETSGWVHLSDKHFFNCLKMDPGNNQFQSCISLEDPLIPDRLYLESMMAFKEATELLFKYINGWIFTKDNPKLVQEKRETFIAEHGYPPSY